MDTNPLHRCPVEGICFLTTGQRFSKCAVILLWDVVFRTACLLIYMHNLLVALGTTNSRLPTPVVFVDSVNVRAWRSTRN